MPDLAQGAVFAGHRIEGVAGRGGMGTVYRATHLALDHMVALKVIAPDLAGDESFRERFKSESRIAVSLRHPNVVPIHHAGEEEGLLFVTMDLIDGPDLRRLLIARGPLEPEPAVAILEQVASALDIAHSRGLVHRDIKPGNVLIEDAGGADHAYLTDFGLTKRIEGASEASGLTSTGAFVGTLDYVAPEQIRGEDLDARTDVYALGCVLYEMLAGEAPFADREEKVAKMYAHLQDAPEALTGRRAMLQAVVERAIAKDREGRFPSAGDLARAASAALGGASPVEAERSVATGRAAPTRPFGAIEAEPAAPEPTIEAAVPADSQATQSPAAEPTEATATPHPEPGDGSDSPSGPDEPGSRRPHGPLIAAALGVVVAAGVAAVLLAGGGDPGSESPSADATAPVPAVDGPPIAVEGMPVGIGFAQGQVLVAARQSGELTSIDAESRIAGAPLGVGEAPEAVAEGNASFWVSVSGAGRVVLIEPGAAELRPGAVDDIGGAPRGLAVDSDAGTAWIAVGDRGEVVRAALGARAADDQGSPIPVDLRVPVGDSPHGVAIGGGRVWVSNRESGTLSAFDQPPAGASAPEVQTVALGEGSNPKGVAHAGGSAWVALTGTGEVVRVGADLDVASRLDVGGEPRGVAAGFGAIWVANGEGWVNRIDLEDERVSRVGVEGSPEEAVTGAGRVWVSLGNGQSVVALDPGG